MNLFFFHLPLFSNFEVLSGVEPYRIQGIIGLIYISHIEKEKNVVSGVYLHWSPL